MEADTEYECQVEAAARHYLAGRPAEAFTAILAALRLDAGQYHSQSIALKILVRVPDRSIARLAADWLAACHFGNLENAAVILSGGLGDSEDGSEVYPLFASLSVIALRLGKPDLSLELFGRCLSDSLPPPLGATVVETTYSGKSDSYDDDALHETSVAAFMDFLDRTLERTAPCDIVDAPCGTGLAGSALRPWARRLVGSDLSPAMVAHAATRGGYDELIVGDLVETLPRLTADLVVSHGSLYYFKDLGPVAAAAAAGLRPGGRFAFSDFPAPHGVMVTTGGTRRYCRSPQVVRDTLTTHGFTEVASQLGLTFGLPCLYWLFRKGST